MTLADLKWPKQVFVTGTGTDVGKSYATGWLARELNREGVSCITQKMIQTGNIGHSEDIDRHRQIMGTGLLEVDRQGITATEIFSYPCSPHLAAKIDKRPIDFIGIKDATDTLSRLYDVVLVEGAGGIMVPLKNEYLTIDYIKEFDLPVIVTIGGQLGSINHALLTLCMIENYDLDLFGVVYNPFFDKDKTICDDTKEYLQDWLAHHFPNAVWIGMPVL